MSNASATRTKATIINLDKGGNPVTCHFNPNSYTFQKSNSWTQDASATTSIPRMEFQGGQPAVLTMQLFFDTYTQNESGGTPKDVRQEYTDGLWQLMMVDPSLRDAKSQKGRPPMVRFQWGKTWTFDAVIVSMNQKFTLFAADGTPVRATVDVTFQQIKDEKQLSPQNPTSAGDGGERVWTVGEGDTLSWIAFKNYGDATRWRPIADANRVHNVRDLTPGQALIIPTL